MGIISECQHDLLIRIISENPDLKDKQISENHIKKLKSAVIFNTLIKHDMIVGYTNQQVYNVYCEIASTLSVPALSKIDFSRTLCKYYGFSVIDFRSEKDNVKHRIYDKNEFLKNRKLQSFLDFVIDKTAKDIVGKTNQELYSEYLDFFKEHEDKSWKKPISKIDFGRRIGIFFNVTLKTTTRNKKACRVFRLKEGGRHGDDSSGQESLG